MTGNCAGWIAYSYLTQDYFLLVGNVPGLVLSIWMNMCASKLQYHEFMMSRIGEKIDDVTNTGHGNGSTDADDTPPAKDANGGGYSDGQVAAPPAPHERLVVCIVVLWVLIFSSASLLPISPSTARQIIGYCVIANLMFFYGAPLSTIAFVVRERNSGSIHRRTMAANTINGAFWCAYGVGVGDPIIYGPNGAGAMLGVVQMVLIVFFPADDGGEGGSGGRRKLNSIP